MCVLASLCWNKKSSTSQQQFHLIAAAKKLSFFYLLPFTIILVRSLEQSARAMRKVENIFFVALLLLYCIWEGEKKPTLAMFFIFMEFILWRKLRDHFLHSFFRVWKHSLIAFTKQKKSFSFPVAVEGCFMLHSM